MRKFKKISAVVIAATMLVQVAGSNVFAAEVEETQNVSQGAKYLEEMCSSEEEEVQNVSITDEQIALMNDYSTVVNYFSDTSEYELGYKANIAGIYCGEEEGIVVYTTDEDLTAVKNQVDSLVGADVVRVEHAEFSYNELLALQSGIQAYIEQSQKESDLWSRIIDVSIDDKTNKVVKIQRINF